VDTLSILSVLIGALFIAVRGPLLFAPNATLRFYYKFLSTNSRIRITGIAIAPIGLALIGLPLGSSKVAEILFAVGWLWAAATLWLVVAPGSYQRFAVGVLDFLESSVDEAIVRMMGAVAVAIGIALIYFGIYVA
jgi:hypothetical protein